MINKIFKGIAVLSIAPLITQLFSFLVIPIITRIYSPEIIGQYNAISSLASIAFVFLAFGYNPVIILSNRTNLNLLVFNTNILLLLISLLLIIPSFYFISILSGLTTSVGIYALIVALIFLEGIYLFLNAFKLSQRKYKSLTISRIIRVIATKSVLILLGLCVGASFENVIIADIVASILTSVFLFQGFFNMFNFKILSVKRIMFLVRSYYHLAISGVSSDLIFRINQFVVNILILNLFGLAYVGNYGISILILSVPSALVSGAMGEVYLAELSKSNSTQEISAIVFKILRILFSFTFPIFLFISLYGGYLVPKFLGPSWSGVVDIITIMPFYSLSIFLIGPLLNIFKILNRNIMIVYFQLSLLFISLISFFVGSKFNSFNITLILMVFLSIFITVCVIFAFSRILNTTLMNVFIDFAKVILCGLPAIFISKFLLNFSQHEATGLSYLVIICSFTFTYLLNFFFVKSFNQELVAIFKSVKWIKR